jgi:hypothetical protein
MSFSDFQNMILSNKVNSIEFAKLINNNPQFKTIYTDSLLVAKNHKCSIEVAFMKIVNNNKLFVINRNLKNQSCYTSGGYTSDASGWSGYGNSFCRDIRDCASIY